MAFFLPAIPAGAAIGSVVAAVLGRVFLWVLLAKGAAVVARVMGVLGLAWFTYQWILEPALNLATGYWSALPAQLVQWLSAFGVLECASILVSGYMLWGAKKIFLGRRS